MYPKWLVIPYIPDGTANFDVDISYHDDYNQALTRAKQVTEETGRAHLVLANHAVTRAKHEVEVVVP